MGSSTCGLQLNGSAAAATPAQSNDANDAVITMKESSALIYLSPNGTSVVDFIGYFFLRLLHASISENLKFLA